MSAFVFRSGLLGAFHKKRPPSKGRQLVAGETGLEPAACGFGVRRSIQLSCSPKPLSIGYYKDSRGAILVSAEVVDYNIIGFIWATLHTLHT
jgi:hypothetical protein